VEKKVVTMLKKIASYASAMLLACCLSPRTVFAQQGAAVLVGTVIDTSTKQPLADVVATVTSPALQGEQTVVTDNGGLYRIPGLSPGVYTLRLDREKYRPYVRDGIALRSDTTIRVNAELLPEGLKAEEVTVVARPPTVDVGSSSTGMNISQDFTHRIPMSRPGAKGSGNRSFESVAEAVPGAAEDRYGTSIAGTTSPENSYVIDGTSVNNTAVGTIGTPLSLEFINELNVISAGYMPEYGRSMGGIFNVVTKSGSNEFHGDVFAYYSPGALEGKRKVVTKDSQSVVTTQQLGYIGDIGADIGGPIKKDKLWFYVGFDISRTRIGLGRQLYRINDYDPMSGIPIRDASTGGIASTAPIPGTYHPYAAEMQQIQALGKLTYTVNADNNLTLTLLAAPMTSGGNGKYSIDPQTGLAEVDPVASDGIAGPYSTLGHRREYNAYDASLKWKSEFSNKRILLDTTLGWHHQTTALLPVDGSEPGSSEGLAGTPRITWLRSNSPGPHSITDFTGPVYDPDGANTIPPAYCDPIPPTANPPPCAVRLYNTGGPGFLQRAVLDRYQGRSIVTFLFQGAGHHVVKAGVDLEWMGYRDTKAYSGGVYLREDPGGQFFDDFRSYGYLTGADQAVILTKVEKITKSITAGGFVQDSWSVVDKFTFNFGVRYDAQFLYNSAGERSLSLPNEWSPRVGLIYDPTQSGRAKIMANFARAYESVPLDLADRALSPEPGILSRHPARGTSACPAGSAAAAGGTIGPCLDPTLRGHIPNPLWPAQPQPDPNTVWTATGAGAEPIDPDIKPQSSDELVFGAEYEVIKDGRLGATYTKKWLNHVIEDMSRDEATTFFLGNPGEGMASDFPKAVRNYDAVTVYFTKSFVDDWQVQASYTWSSLRGNYAGLFRPETGQLDPNINSDFDLRSLLPNRTGPLPGDRTHQIKLFGSKDWALGLIHQLSTGLGLRAHSGEPTNVLGAHGLYGLDEVFILERGSQERLPWNYSADLQLGYRYNIEKGKSISFTVDVFNLFNFQGVTAVDQRYTATDVLPVPGGRQINANGTITGLRDSNGNAFGYRRDLDPDFRCENPLNTPAQIAERCPINYNFRHPTQYQPPRVFRFGIRGTF
jgi:hypothetical protein